MYWPAGLNMVGFLRFLMILFNINENHRLYIPRLWLMLHHRNRGGCHLSVKRRTQPTPDRLIHQPKVERNAGSVGDGDHGVARLHCVPDEVMQGWLVHIGQTLELNPVNPQTVRLCGHGDDHFAQRQSARDSASFHAAPISFIHLDYALQKTIPFQTCHRPPLFMEDCPCCPIAAQPQNPLQSSVLTPSFGW
jgi:hypothetical protein